MTWSLGGENGASPVMPSLNDAAALIVNVYVPAGQVPDAGAISTSSLPSDCSASMTAGLTVMLPAAIAAATDASVMVWLKVRSTTSLGPIVLLSIGAMLFSAIAEAVVNETTCAAPFVNVDCAGMHAPVIGSKS